LQAAVSRAINSSHDRDLMNVSKQSTGGVTRGS
jgi:hypothetical protein